MFRGEISPSVPLDNALEIVRSRLCGHSYGVGTVQKLGLPRLLGGDRARRNAVLTMNVCWVITLASKLATARALRGRILQSLLDELLDLESVSENGLSAALDGLPERQASIEEALDERHM